MSDLTPEQMMELWHSLPFASQVAAMQPILDAKRPHEELARLEHELELLGIRIDWDMLVADKLRQIPGFAGPVPASIEVSYDACDHPRQTCEDVGCPGAGGNEDR